MEDTRPQIAFGTRGLPGVKPGGGDPVRIRSRRAGLLLAGLAAALLCASVGSAAEREPTEAEIGEVQHYLTPAEALHEIFEEVSSVDTVEVVLSRGETEALREALGWSLLEERLTLYRPRDDGGRPLGTAAVVDEKGKYRPITFMVGVTPEGRVKGVEVLVYRESRGGEVRRTRFLRQYRNKTAEDPVRINRDIINIAGATISVNSMNRGVRRVLLTLDLLERRAAEEAR